MRAFRMLLRTTLLTSLVFLVCGIAHAQRAYLSGLSVRTTVDSDGAWLFFTLDPERGTRTVMISAAGPGVSRFGVTGTISDPQLEVWDQHGDRIGYNDDRSDALLKNSNYSFVARAPKDAGLMLTLVPGVYSVRVSDVGSATGIAYIEIYDAAVNPGVVSLAVRGRSEPSGYALIGSTMSGSGNINLAAFASGPNLPLTNPMGDPYMSIYSGISEVAKNEDYSAATAATASLFLSPMLGNPKNAGHVFVWTYGPNVAPANGPVAIQLYDHGGSGNSSAFLFELHDRDTISPRPPVIYVPPTNTTVALGAELTLRVLTGGQYIPTFQWQRNGVDIPGETSAVFTRTNATLADAGSYRVRVTSSVGTTVSPSGTVTVTLPPPIISVQPQSTTSIVGQPATLSVFATGSGLSYQWLKNGVAIPGATSSVLTLGAAVAADAGVYSVVVTNSSGSVTSVPVALSVVTNPGRLTNVSLRASAGTGERTLILGFALDGVGSKPLTIRGIGPALSSFGVTNVLADPRLGIYVGQAELMANDNWSGADGSTIGGFPLPVGSKDAVVSNSFDARSYTAQVTGIGGGTGNAMVELYDGAPGNLALRLVNLSARTQLGEGETLIVGLSLTGSTTKRLIIRAVGPTLAGFGVTTAHPDPRIELYSASGVKLAENDQWSGDDGRTAGAFPLAVGSKDAVISTSFDPTAYTVHVKGAPGASGVVLVEVYEAP